MIERKGQKILNSNLYRVFCENCGTPMRTTKEEIDDGHWCEICSPKPTGLSSPTNKLDVNYEGLPDVDAFLPSWKRENT